MPITFSCNSCDKKLRVKDELAGKKVKCPGCATVLHVPAASTAAAAGPGSSAGGSSAGGGFYVKTDDGATYGPVSKTELDQWVTEGRLNSESQILREGAAQWQWASDEYPQLDQSASGGGQSNPFDFAAQGGGAGGGGGFPIDTGGGGGGYRAPHTAARGRGQVGNKSKIAAGLLGIFLGGWGIHRFYLGYTSIGAIQIVVTLLTCGLGAWWGLIEGIMILVGSIDRDADGYLLKD